MRMLLSKIEVTLKTAIDEDSSHHLPSIRHLLRRDFFVWSIFGRCKAIETGEDSTIAHVILLTAAIALEILPLLRVVLVAEFGFEQLARDLEIAAAVATERVQVLYTLIDAVDDK